MIISVSNERAAQVSSAIRFAGDCVLISLAAIALFLICLWGVSAKFGFCCGQRAREAFIAWGGRKRLGEVTKIVIVEVVAAIAWLCIYGPRIHRAAFSKLFSALDWVMSVLSVWPAALIELAFCLEHEAAAA